MQKIVKIVNLFMYRALRSTKFFVVSLGLFTMHTTWLALSARSLPFDEYYHLALIKFYSHQWSPFISHQPASLSYLADITRLPSYLYHYLMSFPYRLLEQLISSPYWLLVSMRLINIALVIAGIILFRRLLLKTGFSRRVVHVALFVFMMLPIVNLLAAELNYDNLMFLLTPIFLGFAINLSRGQSTIKNVAGFVSVGLFTCLVKNQFVVLVGITSLGIIYFITREITWVKFWKTFKKSLATTKSWQVLLLTIIVLMLLGLFGERYGVNLIKYHQINVKCDKVQSFEVCKHSSPWLRNYESRKNPPPEQIYGNPLSFTQHWVSTLTRGATANITNAINETKNCDPQCNYQTGPDLPLLHFTISFVLGLGALISLFNIKKWWHNRRLRTLIIFCLAYAFVLWAFNFNSYLNNGRAYAIQLRYLLPILIFVMVVAIEQIGLLIRDKNWRTLLATVMITIFIYNGGAFGWFIRARSDWYWPNQTIININHDVQKVLQKVIIN